MKIGVIGVGFVGGAVSNFFARNGHEVVCYDLHKRIGALNNVLTTEIVFLCLPTVYDDVTKQYNKQAIMSTCRQLDCAGYTGCVIIKSTVEPTTTASLAERHPSLSLLHNPEFLTASTASEDFAHQKHIVLGATSTLAASQLQKVINLYTLAFPDSNISTCTSDESEAMKIFANTFYAVKIQYFNEVFAMCQKIGADYTKVRDLIVKNGWVNEMHTKVPGTDGKLSYGGLCFPKDTSAVAAQMGRMGVPNQVIQATVDERNTMRSDYDNIKKEDVRHVNDMEYAPP